MPALYYKSPLSMLYVLCTLAALTEASRALPTAINTTSGRFAPYFSESEPRVASFLNIPYAETPTGPLRFEPPVAKAYKNDKVVRATTLPAGCIQYVAPNLRGTIADGPVTAAAFQRGEYSNTTEDCLRLSVFTPRMEFKEGAYSSHESLPVVIWIHGGGYSFGGTNVPFQLAPKWVQRSQKHMVVQVQYRLNLLGLPNAAALDIKGENLNLAFLDQRLAVEWVRDNIARFGGDPERITLWGESAGAYAADGYLFAWPGDPIVKGVIADSGNAVAMEGALSDPKDHKAFSLAASRLGCGNLSPPDELSCMRRVPEAKMKAYLQAEVGQGGAADDALVFGAIPDNVTVFADYTERIIKNFSKFPAKIPVLIGTNANEGAAVVPCDFEGSETATELPSNLARNTKVILDNYLS
ncbi:hypothetical protein FZEAL_8509 [Fusarium zealandicum]|uniref:Carboxylic ester hydrolase n=1 Tax=Fusarium zealandicum TaxID=1053134 RepID=A0A8H4UE72_9HYPO|nr:hypothetical protein FZEAL_8509 [Fusarium zealandicum]